MNEGVDIKTKACLPRILFPQEIMDQFIDHLHDNVPALKECALVCRAWVYQSRWHLFRMIHILPPVLAPDKGSFATLSRLLEHPLCTFASSVRKLSIFDPYEQDSSILDSSWINLLVTQLNRLVSVNALDLNLSDGDITVYLRCNNLEGTLFHITADPPYPLGVQFGITGSSPMAVDNSFLPVARPSQNCSRRQ